jgi:hypothetical protein
MGVIKYFIGIVSTVLICFVTNLYAADKVKTAGPVIFIEQEIFTTQRIIEGQDVVHTFMVLNRGTAPLHILNVRSDCNCTTVQFDRTVPADGKGKITLKIDTTGSRGKIIRRSTVLSDDPKTPVRHIEIHLTITPVISIEPSRVTMYGFPEQALSKEVLIRSNIEKPLELKEKQLTIPSKIKYRMTTLRETHSYVVTFQNLIKEPEVYRGRLILETNFPERPVIVVPIFCKILDDIQVTPNTVDFGCIRKDHFLKTIGKKAHTNKHFLERLPKLEKEIIVCDNRKNNFKIRRMEIDTRYFCTDIKAFPNGNRYRIKLIALIQKMGKELIETPLKIHTNSKSHPVIEIPVRILVQ